MDRKRGRRRVRFSCGRSKSPSRRVAIAVLGLALFAGADAPDPAALALASLQARYDRINDFRAAFVQEAHVAALARDDVSRGRVSVRRPGHMRWQYTEPEPRVIVVDASTIRLYSPAESQLQIISVSSSTFSPTALTLLFGEGRLDESFSPELIDSDADQLGLRLRPRGDAAFEYLEVWLRASDSQLLASVVVDLFGNRTRIRFEDIVENAGIDDAEFTVVVPEGTEIIDLR